MELFLLFGNGLGSSWEWLWRVSGIVLCCCEWVVHNSGSASVVLGVDSVGKCFDIVSGVWLEWCGVAWYLLFCLPK